MELIKCIDVCKTFGEKVALDKVSVSIPKGKIFGLLGPNGAGKTTLIRIINRITIPSSGTVLFDGRPITQDDVLLQFFSAPMSNKEVYDDWQLLYL